MLLKAYFNIALFPGFVSKKPLSLSLKSLLNKPNLSIIRDSFKVVKAWGFIMYAVIKTGGKQYRVNQGDKLKIEKIAGDVGANVVLDQILTVVDGDNVTIGSPIVRGASVTATVVSHGRHDKVRIFKMRRRKHYRKSQGHRQSFTEIQIDKISAK